MSFALSELPVRLPMRPRLYLRALPTPPSRDGLPRRQIIVGDAATRLQELPTSSIDCCVTSPPYYMLRNYRTSGQLGLEAAVDGWVEDLRRVVAEVARVLKPAGSLWLNLGDTFSRAPRYGAASKSLMLAPERLAVALLADGWIVRNKVIWAKTNPMPHSVSDRLNTTYELIYFLVRSRRYYFSLDAIRTPHRSTRRPAVKRPGKYESSDRSWAGPLAGSNGGLAKAHAEGRPGHPLGANPGDVWHLATGGYRGAHFATFPETLITRPILATCPERLCAACGKPWQRGVTAPLRSHRLTAPAQHANRRSGHVMPGAQLQGDLVPTCDCNRGWRPGVVLDPFFGSGTVGVVAEQHRRDWIGVELNPAYVTLAEERIEAAREKRRRAP